MRKLVLIATLLALPLLSKAQYYWDFGGGFGAANFLGEMGGDELTRRDFIADLKLQQTRTAINGFARYKISPMFSVKAGITWAVVRGADSLSSNPPRHYRNLTFKNNLVEALAECQFFFYEVNDLGHTYRYKDNFRAYIGLGVGAVYHNPKGFYQGEWVNLRPLTTEGIRYTQVTLVIPASAGFYFTINKRHRIGWNLCWRTTFSDYLDDVSGQYADPSLLPSDMSAIMADRTDHAAADAFGLQAGYGPGWGNNFGYSTYVDQEGVQHFNKRGDNTHNDSYITTQVEYSYVLRGRSSIYKSKYGNIFKGRNKYKRRKVRAKF
ncbi:MAG TPA: DUF6089 family protein [Bacteroidia bacterium]|nr:DUF6089 family protein [Bacteroidia bacterium]